MWVGRRAFLSLRLLFLFYISAAFYKNENQASTFNNDTPIKVILTFS